MTLGSPERGGSVSLSLFPRYQFVNLFNSFILQLLFKYIALRCHPHRSIHSNGILVKIGNLSNYAIYADGDLAIYLKEHTENFIESGVCAVFNSGSEDYNKFLNAFEIFDQDILRVLLNNGGGVEYINKAFES